MGFGLGLHDLSQNLAMMGFIILCVVGAKRFSVCMQSNFHPFPGCFGGFNASGFSVNIALLLFH